MNTGDIVSLDQLLFDIQSMIGDEERKSGYSKGWYTSRIKDAITELAIDSFFEVLTIDLEIPQDTLTVDLPENMFNLRELYVFNGDCCNPTSSAIVNWKRLMNNGFAGTTATGRRIKSGTGQFDPFVPRPSSFNLFGQFGRSGLLTANIYDGRIMFDESAAAYSHVRLVVNGLGGAHGSEPSVPRIFKEAIIDWVSEAYFRRRKVHSKSERIEYNDAVARLNNPRGNWENAKRRAKKSDTWKKESLNEYMGRPDI